LQKKTFQALKSCFFFHAALLKLRDARLCKKNNFSDSIFFCTLTLGNSDKPGFAKKKSGSKKLLFSALLHETQTSPALQKKQLRL